MLYDSSFKCLERDDGDSYTTDLEKSKQEVKYFKEAYYGTSIRKKIMIDIANKNEDQVWFEVYDFLKDSLYSKRYVVPNSLIREHVES